MSRIPRTDLLANHFTYETGTISAYSCNHCGGLVVMSKWELHVMACPALAKWDREQAAAEEVDAQIGHG